MKKFLIAAVFAAVTSMFFNCTAEAEMVSVPGTNYYIFTETLKYDPAPTHLGHKIKNGYRISVEGTNANYKFPNGQYIRCIYYFSRITDKTWTIKTNDEKIMPPAVYADSNAYYEVDKDFINGVVYAILMKTFDYLPAEDAAEFKADLAQQAENSSSSGNPKSSPSIGNLPDAATLAELKQAAEPFITQADAKFKAKDYTAAKELFSQAIEKNPYDYHSHDLYARSMYREKSKDKNYDLILDEAKKALELATDNKAKADCCGFIAKVYRKLTMNNLFNSDKSNTYLNLGQKYLDMENQFRQQK